MGAASLDLRGCITFSTRAWGADVSPPGGARRGALRANSYARGMVIPFVATPSWSVVPSQPTEPDGSGLSRQESVLGEEPVLPQQLSRENISSGTSGARSSTLTSLSREDINLLGPLAPFALAGAVTDLFVNGAEGLWIDRGRGAER